ncbi:hypothetical protein Tco_0369039 [Tanacetum coccineum]
MVGPTLQKSTTGGCQFLGQRLISWQCKKQTIVATSTTEAEYVAAANCCGQVLWVQNQLLNYGFNFMNTKIHIDNESTICIVKNPVYHSKTKHIEIRHHFIRDCYEKKLISVEKIHTGLNVADLLTKPFDGPRKHGFRGCKAVPRHYLLLRLFDSWPPIKNTATNISNGFCSKPVKSAGFAEIVDFLRGSNLRYALTTNPTIYDSLVKQFWQTATTKTLADGTLELHATIDTIVYTITEASIRNKLQLANASGITITIYIFYHQNNLHRPISAPKLLASTPTPILETDPEPMEHTFEEPSPAHQHFSPPQEHAQGQMTVDDLLQLVPQLRQGLISWKRILKQTKATMGKCYYSEEEEPEAQGRKSQDDPLVSLVQGLVTPSKTTVNASGEEQNKGRRYKRRKETKGKKVVTSLDFQEEVSTGYAEGVNTGSIKVSTVSGKVSTVSGQVSTDSIKKSIPSPDKGQREGKAPMIIEEAPKKTKEQILQEEASLAEAIRLDTLEKEEEAKQVHLDSLLAQRLAEEEELNEQQKQRRAQVQFEAQHYTDEDWDLIRAKIEANAELSKSVLGSGLQGEDFAKKMVELVNQRKKHFAEERARAKRNKPITQSQLRTYMMNYLKNQGTWKLSQLKNLSFEEVKEEFDKLVKQVESFAPINFEATKDSLKRFGEELQTKTLKRLKSDEAKDDESTKKTGKRRKQIARKGLHSDKTDEDESKASKDADPISGKEGVYQIVREDGTDIVYINFGAMLKDITQDDLTELYRIVMNRYGMNGPEDSIKKETLEIFKE